MNRGCTIVASKFFILGLKNSAGDPWEVFFAFLSTKVKKMPGDMHKLLSFSNISNKSFQQIKLLWFQHLNESTEGHFPMRISNGSLLGHFQKRSFN